MCGSFLKKAAPIALAIAGVVTGNPQLISAGVSAFGSAQQAQQAKKAQKVTARAAKTADENAKANLAQQEREVNRANAKQPNVAALLAQNTAALDLGSTNLTGPGGVARSELQLGQNTLLGQ